MSDGGSPQIVEQVRTLRVAEYANLLWVEVRTSDGAVGTGEACLGPESVEAYIHDVAESYLLGKDALDIERHDRALRGYLGYDGAGVETRGNGAINIALWDFAGHVTGQPLYNLLGGRAGDRIRVYNTCAGYEYARKGGLRSGLANSGLADDRQIGPYDDLVAWTERPAESRCRTSWRPGSPR